jgi:AcrR family transcriptional regulator
MAHTSERILDAAEKIYRTAGADALSMRRMADDLGISATALYRHYAGKDELLDAVANRAFEKLATEFREAAKKRTPRAKLLAVFESFRAFALKRPALFDLMYFHQRPGARRFPADIASGASPTANVVVELLTQMNVKDPLDAALLLWAEAQGLVSLHRAGRFESDSVFQRAWDRLFARLLQTLAGSG